VISLCDIIVIQNRQLEKLIDPKKSPNMKKILITILTLLIVVIAGLLIFIMTSWNKDFNAPYPDITASTDSAVIARGAYLAYGPGHCAYCHMPAKKLPLVAAGERIPLSGGWVMDIPPGTFRAPNLTPDTETGIGKLSDKEIARTLRYMVKHNNKFMLPAMEFTEMSDEDIRAIISFLRSQPPVKNAVPPSEFKFLGKALLAFGILKPQGPKTTPPVNVPVDSTASYGSYIANSVANCLGCHTSRDLKTGAYTGPKFSGGFMMPAENDPEMEGYNFVSPNLTPDPKTGVIVNWDEKTFIERFQAGRLQAGSPMPWEAFAMMNETELKALYRYLRSLEPQTSKVRKTVYAPGEELPEL
jgi:mono/diheme cytochrome c family protein